MALRASDAAINAAVAEATPNEVVLNDVQHDPELREDEHLVAIPLEPVTVDRAIEMFG